MESRPTLSLDTSAQGGTIIRLAGDWRLKGHLPSTTEAEQTIASRGAAVGFDSTDLGGWDTSLITALLRILESCRREDVRFDAAGLPGGVRRLIELAEAVPEKSGARRAGDKPPFLARVGTATAELASDARDFLAFLGNATVAASRMLTGRASYRFSDLALIAQQCGVQALGIVSLISFLVGTILAFVGAVQLQQFGAAIYVADLVGIAMARDMGAMMTAIVMAGRTGASFAAELGTMKVNREIDALTTMGISPMEFLVVPRMLALFLMMPMLALYSDLMGILGGAAVGVGMLDLSIETYYAQTAAAVGLADVIGGVFKASVYGALVAIAGCLRGIECGNSASAVGEATTSAVVTSIVLIIGACGTFAVLFYILGI